MQGQEIQAKKIFPLAFVLVFLLAAGSVFAHNLGESDAQFLEQNPGNAWLVFAYLGAKHMFTGYDHVLYLAGVIFFLHRAKDVALYVTLFAVGHSITLMAGVLGEIHVNAFAIDALIGLSVSYKAFENLGGFAKSVGYQPNPKVAVFCFGLAHGFGLATKLQELSLSKEGLISNILGFNFGVEIGQLMALALLLVVINFWRGTSSFAKYSIAFNFLLMFAGFLLAGYQVTSYLVAT